MKTLAFVAAAGILAIVSSESAAAQPSRFGCRFNDFPTDAEEVGMAAGAHAYVQCNNHMHN